MIIKKLTDLSTKVFVKSATSTGYRIAMVSVYTTLIVGLFAVDTFAAAAAAPAGSNGILDNLGNMVKNTQTTLLGISTGAAGVGIGTGVFMKKFSMGKQDRIETGNRLIRDSVIGWGTINGAGQVLTWVGNYTGTSGAGTTTP